MDDIVDDKDVQLNGEDGRTRPRVSVTFSDPDVVASLSNILSSSLGHSGIDQPKRLALWSIYYRLNDAEKRLRAKRGGALSGGSNQTTQSR